MSGRKTGSNIAFFAKYPMFNRAQPPEYLTLSLFLTVSCSYVLGLYVNEIS